MTLSLKCKDAGDPVCTHTLCGETEEELLQNAKTHGIEVHGYTEDVPIAAPVVVVVPTEMETWVLEATAFYAFL
jgi:hypothetical protein